MNKYKINVLDLSWFPFGVEANYKFESEDSLEVFVKNISRDGFRTSSGAKWILPGAILSIEKADA